MKFMRKFLRCESGMLGDLALYSTDSHWRITAAEPRPLFPKGIGKLCCAVCPKCGYAELYIEELASDKE